MPNNTQSQATGFRTYYDLETYLFDTVSQRFAENRTLSAFDFFCIVIWKANRAKSRIARRLLAKGPYADLDSAVHALVGSIATAPSPKERLRVLIQDWGFLLPMASATLTVLYPHDFTIYDIRVYGGLGDFEWVQNKTRYDELWDGYSKYITAVEQAAPAHLSLRDKDRWLWGKSFYEQLQHQIEVKFPSRRSEDETGT
jgi:hypothetical protein